MIEFGKKSVVIESIKRKDLIYIDAYRTLYISLLGNDLAAFSYDYPTIKQRVSVSNKILAITGPKILLRSKLVDAAHEVSKAV